MRNPNFCQVYNLVSGNPTNQDLGSRHGSGVFFGSNFRKIKSTFRWNGYLSKAKIRRMGRQIAALLSGIVAAYLLQAMGGYLLYVHYRYSDYSAGAVARYILVPVVSLLTGVLVGVIANQRPALLAALSLLPSNFYCSTRSDGAVRCGTFIRYDFSRSRIFGS